MNAVWARVRVELRRRAAATVALTVLVALAAGVVIASVAGARRTESAMDRFVSYSRPDDLFVQSPDGATAEKVARLSQVAQSTRSPFVFLTHRADGADSGDFASFAAADDRAFRTMDRVLVVRGRLARLDDPTEVMVNSITARRLHLVPGPPSSARGVLSLLPCSPPPSRPCSRSAWPVRPRSTRASHSTSPCWRRGRSLPWPWSCCARRCRPGGWPP